MNLSYKGYTTILNRDSASQVWHGRVSGIQDIVTFEAITEAAAEAEFHKAVDTYLSFCQMLNQVPNTPLVFHC